MRRDATNMNNEIILFIKVIFILIIGLLIMDFLSKQNPDNQAIKDSNDSFAFIARLFIDWISPDPMLWIIRILILGAGAFGVYKYFTRDSYQ